MTSKSLFSNKSQLTKCSWYLRSLWFWSYCWLWSQWCSSRKKWLIWQWQCSREEKEAFMSILWVMLIISSRPTLENDSNSIYHSNLITIKHSLSFLAFLILLSSSQLLNSISWTLTMSRKSKLCFHTLRCSWKIILFMHYLIVFLIHCFCQKLLESAIVWVLLWKVQFHPLSREAFKNSS